MLYGFFRGLSWLSLHIFYRKICLIGGQNRLFESPAIVVSNHPSTLIDPLAVGIHTPQQMFFLANYGLFKNPISNWVFRRLFAIPVKRREDVEEGEERNNDAAFEACFEHLKKRGTLFACPEGTSWMQRWVRPLKTGVARIAFGAESRNNWNLDVKIIPVGLDYSAPNLFRSRLTVNFGEPILVKNWRTHFERDPVEAVEKLTQHIQFQLKSLCVDCRDEAGEAQVRRLEKLTGNDRIVDCEQRFFQSKKIAEQVVASADPNVVEIQNLNEVGIAPVAPLPSIFWQVLLFPFFLVGYSFWFLPCFLPYFLEKKMKLYVGYGATVKVLAGILTFSTVILGTYFFLKYWFDSLLLAVVGVAGLVVAGFAAEKFMDFWQARRRV